MPASNLIHVAVGVLLNSANEVLIAFRHPDSHQGSLWEFPGGKLEAGEDVTQALQREFAEELGIEVVECSPFTRITHHYADKSVLLDVWKIDKHRGVATGLEGQPLRWLTLEQLRISDFPAANAAIITRLQLPPEIAITPDVDSLQELEAVMQQLLSRQLQIIQFRQSAAQQDTYLRWFQWANQLCRSRNVKLMFNQQLASFPLLDTAGYHANSQTLMSLSKRPLANDLLFSASCHNLAELQQAQKVGADFVYLSPVCQTDKYPAGKELGWQQFQTLAASTELPVYALGGLQRHQLVEAQSRGAAGISGIRTFLRAPAGDQQ